MTLKNIEVLRLTRHIIIYVTKPNQCDILNKPFDTAVKPPLVAVT